MTEQDTRTAPAGDLPGDQSVKLYSLAEVAKICEVSRQAVYKRLHNDNQLTEQVDRLTQSDGRRRLFTPDAVEVLKQVFSKSGTAPESGNQLTTEVDRLTKQVDTDLTTKVDALTKEVDRLTTEIDTERQKHETERKELTTKVDTLTAERDRLRDQLDDAAADRKTLIRQVNQMRGEITGHAAEVKRLVDQLDQLRQDHREELDRNQAGHAAELDRLREDHRQRLDDLRAQLEEVKRDLTEERQHSRDTAERLAQLADQAQRLQLAQMQPPAALPEEITPQDKPPTLWQRIFGKKG